MKIREQTSDFLILEEFPIIMGPVMGILALILLVLSLVSFSNQDYNKFYGGMLGFALCFVGFVVLFKKSRFEFCHATGRLEWSRRGLFSRKGWTVPLSDIENVILRTGLGEDNEYTVFLITARGKMPLNVYGTNEKQIRVTHASVRKEEAENISNLIRRMLGKSDVDIAEESIRELVKAGSIVDACKLAEEHYNLNLTEARKRIDQIKQEITKG